MNGTVSKLSANYWRWPKNHPNDLNFMELHPLKTPTLEFLPPQKKQENGFLLWNLALFQVRFAVSLGVVWTNDDFCQLQPKALDFPPNLDQKTVHTYQRYSGGDMKIHMLAVKSCCIYLSILIYIYICIISLDVILRTSVLCSHPWNIHRCMYFFSSFCFSLGRPSFFAT